MLNKISYLCLPLFLFASQIEKSNAQVDSTNYKYINSIIEQGQKQFAPDKRTKLIELSKADIPSQKYIIKTTEKDVVPFLKNNLANSTAQVDIQLYPDAELGNKIYGVVQLSVANLRTKPGHASEMATQVLLGTQVDILQKVSGEYRVRTPEGYIAYIPTSSLTAMNESELQNWKSSKKVIYTQDFGKTYAKADVKSNRVSDLVYGNILSLIKETKKFYEVKYPDGRIGFIPKNEATSYEKWINTRQLNPENVLASAKTMMGLPYLWGGTSAKGVDCSGFTKTSFFMNGYVIPRDASQQVLAGDQVDILDENGDFDAAKALANLKPADLLFFAANKEKSKNARVTHVALYIGNGEFIHSAGTVRINSMLKEAINYDDFQTRTVVSARRYIGSSDSQIQKITESKFYN